MDFSFSIMMEVSSLRLGGSPICRNLSFFFLPISARNDLVLHPSIESIFSNRMKGCPYSLVFSVLNY